MRGKLLFFLSIICVIFLVLHIAGLLNQDFDLNREDSTKVSIHIWITTPRLAYILHQYESQSNVRIDLKQFHDTESLLAELKLAQTENTLPDLVEIDSRPGINQLLDSYGPIPLTELVPDMKRLFHPSVMDNFSTDNGLLAYPLGIEIPLIFTNESLLDNKSDVNMYPFRKKGNLEMYREVQGRVNGNNSTKTFWFFHFDENIPWYWTSHQLAAGSEPSIPFKTIWKDLTETYKLVPKFDHHMALTRFANMEIGSLITSSNNIQTIQQSIGNDFEFQTKPFLQHEDDTILVSGHGLAMLKSKEEISDLFTFMTDEEVQRDLLGKTGWLPTQTKLLESSSFIQSLPMSKYLSGLVDYREQFIGMNPDNTIEWDTIMEEVHKIEND